MHGLLSNRSNNPESFKYPKNDACGESTEAKGREQRKTKQYIRNLEEKKTLALFSKGPVILLRDTQKAIIEHIAD